MATLDQLYSYDTAIETAWRDTLKIVFDNDIFQDSTGNQWTVTVHIEQSDEAKNTPFVDIRLENVVAQNHKHFGSDGVQYFDAWEGALVSRVVTQRGVNSDLQSKIIGVTRAHAANYAQIFGIDVAPYHIVQQMRDHGLHRGLMKHEGLDWSEVFHLINFSIRNDAWSV